MEAVNVQETTTTTGTGNITLAGASEDGKTFTSEFSTNQRLSYYIDDRAGNWEHGVGYLSGATTLVREILIDSSTGSPINFAAGTKQVFNGKSAGIYPSLGVEIAANNQLISSHIINSTSSTGLVANRVYYMPFIIDKEWTIDEIGVAISVASGTGADKLHVALYLTTGNNYPGDKLVAGDDLDPSVTGFQTASFTAIKLKPAKYFVGIWSNVTPTLRGAAFAALEPSDMGFSSAVQFNVNGLQESLTSLSTLPDPATPGLTAVLAGANVPTVHLRIA